MERRRNIVLISMDDAMAFWRFRKVFGVELQTPNLDRICAQSTAFHNAYCQVPICGPSRASFMSGLAPHQLGIFDNYSNLFEDCLRPEQIWSWRLKQAGYYCATAGKLHHGYQPRPPEIHDALYSHPAHPCYMGPRASAPHRKYGGVTGGVGTTDPADDSKYYDYFSSEDAIRFFAGYDGPAPFYREIGFHNPHVPLKTPDRFKAMYDEDAFEMPAEWRAGWDPDPFADSAMPHNMALRDKENWRKTIRNYFSCYSHVDWHIGRVWDALQASPHAADTVVILTADHGYHMGERRRFRKYTLWESAAGVPLIVHDPAAPVAREVHDPVALLDVGPTVLDYAGLPAMADSPGRSLRPQVEGAQVEGAQAPGRAVPTFWFGSAAIRQGDYRYILYQDGTDALFDLAQDPWETRNRAETHPERARLRETLIRTAADYGLALGARALDGPMLYAAPAEGTPHPASPPEMGMLAFEAPDPATPDEPGYRRYFIRPRADMELTVPRAYRELFYAGDIADGAENLTVRCHDLGVHVDMIGGHRRFHLTVHGGQGDDTIETAHEPMTLWLNAGRNRVNAGFNDTVIHGGAGHDRIDCQRGDNLVLGGAGSASIRTGIGTDEIHPAAGATEIVCGTGHGKIVLDRGMSLLRIGPEGTAEVLVLRTALPQRIEGYDPARVRLDLSDWRVLGQVTVGAEGADTVLSCGTERLRLVGVAPETVPADVAMGLSS